MLHRPHSWKLIRALAKAGGVKIFAKVANAQTLAEIDKEIAEISDEAKALVKLAKEEDRELSDEEQATLEGLVGEDDGKIDQLKAERAKVEKLIALKKRAALENHDRRGPRNPLDDDGGSTNRAQDNIRVINRLQNFTGEEAARDAYVSGMYLLARLAQKKNARHEKAEQVLQSYGYGGIQNTQTIGTDADGGYLVPDPLQRAIISVRDRHSVMRPFISTTPMTAETLRVNKRTSGLAVYYVDEEASYTKSKMGWDQFTLTAVKRGVMAKVSQELREDAIIPIIDSLIPEFGVAFGTNEDREIVVGDGGAATSGGVTGLVPSLNAAGQIATGADWDGLTLDHFFSAMALLPEKWWPFGPAWLCSSAFYYTVMLRELAKAGGNTIATLEVGGRQVPQFLGRPVIFTDHMPRISAAGVSCLFGSFSEAVMLGERIGVQIGQSEDFEFLNDVLVIKGRTRYDIRVHEAGGGGKAGAYVGLVTV